MIGRILRGRGREDEFNADLSTIASYLPANASIVEAGAHTGLDTLRLAKRFRDSTIYAFEPVPRLFNMMSHRTARCANVRRYCLALADSTGTAKLHVSSGASDASSSILAPKQHLQEHPNVLFPETIEVETVTLDDWAKTQNIAKVDFLWFDMQGYEPRVLFSSPRIVSSASLIYTEVNQLEAYEGAVLYPELREWLESRGYTAVREYFPYASTGNVLFARLER